MSSVRRPASWTVAVTALVASLGSVLIVPSGCSTLPNPACGDEPMTAVCGRLQYECGTAVVCYACGVAKRLNCGTCASTQTCGGGGTPHVCWPPIVDGGEAGVGDAAVASTSDAGGTADASEVDGSSDATPEADGALAPPGDAAADSPVADGASDAASTPMDASDDASPVMVLCSDDAAPEETPDAAP